MNPGLDPLADWFSPLEAAIGEAELSGQIAIQTAAGAGLLASRLDAASAMHSAGEWLAVTGASSEARKLAGGMVAAAITADHYEFHRLVPQSLGRRLRRQAWKVYAARRAAQALDRLADVLLRWSVLERIPVNWVIKEVVFAHMRARFEEEGYPGLSIEGELATPFPGGAEWVSRECAAEQGALRGGSAGSVRAAVLLWPGRVVPAVILGGSAAYAPECGRGAVEVWGSGGSAPGVVLLPPPEEPPASGPMAFWRLLRLDGKVWEMIRRWRVWRRSR